MKRYVICGVSSRAIHMFAKPMYETFSLHAELVGMLDIDTRRFEVMNEELPQSKDVATYSENEFDKMVDECKPDAIIVAGRDHTHVDYILQGLARDLDVITEKPMVTTSEDCRRVLEAEKKSKGKVTVTFNYRYPSVNRKIREMILEDKIGRITSVDLNWYIDTYHGASYFKRWNRQRKNSGGLSIHKSTHHFDLVNWWTGQRPVEVFSFGALNYYGPDGELNPSKKDGRHCSTCDEQANCKYYMRWSSRSNNALPKDDHLGSVKSARNRKAYSTYSPDACIFDSEIDIEDTYTTTVRYDQGALLSYSVNFSVPFEGYRLAINGAKGRLETQEWHVKDRIPFPVPEQQVIDYYPLFGSKETISVVNKGGGHGGGDPIILEDIFLGVDPQRGYEILAGADAGAQAVCTGEAVWRSVKEHKPILISDLLGEKLQAAGS